MALITFKQWKIKESSSSTRQRDGWAKYGNYPPSAGVMSRSTPEPFVMKKALDEFGSPDHPKKKKKSKKKDK